MGKTTHAKIWDFSGATFWTYFWKPKILYVYFLHILWWCNLYIYLLFLNNQSNERATFRLFEKKTFWKKNDKKFRIEILKKTDNEHIKMWES